MSEGNLIRYLSAIVVILAAESVAQAAPITLEFDSLPSDQGWSFVKSTTGSHADDTEAGVFSAAPTNLQMNTIGSGLVSPSGLAYQLPSVVDPNSSWSLDMTLELLQYENGSPGRNDFGAFFGVYGGDYRVGLAISTTGLTTISGETHEFQNDNVVRSYRIEYTPVAGTGTFDLFIDGSSVLSGTGAAVTGQNFLTIGDGTGGANSQWELTNYVFEQHPVPEPTSLALLATGAFGFIGYGWRRKRKLAA